MYADIGLSWGWSFMIIGFITGGFGLIILLFLVPSPRDVGITIREFTDAEY